MTKQEFAAQMEAFSARGGKVNKVAEGRSALDPMPKYCQCGCRGNWTDHTMRLGESGQRGGY